MEINNSEAKGSRGKYNTEKKFTLKYFANPLIKPEIISTKDFVINPDSILNKESVRIFKNEPEITKYLYPVYIRLTILRQTTSIPSYYPGKFGFGEIKTKQVYLESEEIMGSEQEISFIKFIIDKIEIHERDDFSIREITEIHKAADASIGEFVENLLFKEIHSQIVNYFNSNNSISYLDSIKFSKLEEFTKFAKDKIQKGNLNAYSFLENLPHEIYDFFKSKYTSDIWILDNYEDIINYRRDKLKNYDIYSVYQGPKVMHYFSGVFQSEFAVFNKEIATEIFNDIDLLIKSSNSPIKKLL